MRSLFVMITILFLSCSEKKKAGVSTISAGLPPSSWFDSVRQQIDTFYSKNYRNKEFVTADYYVNRKLKSVCQVMKDASGKIRQVIAEKSGIRVFTAEYYSNGQLMATLPLDSLGLYNGNGNYYFENGQVKMEGVFLHGFFSGVWKNYNEKGQMISTDEYNANGQLIKTTKM